MGFIVGQEIEAPSGLVVGFSEHSSASWDKVEDVPGEPPIIGYKIYWVYSDGSSGVKEVLGANTIPLYQLSLKKGEICEISISAFNSKRIEGPKSKSMTVRIPYPGVDYSLPVSPQNLYAEVRGDVVYLNWSSSLESDFLGYRLYVGKNSRNYEGIPISVGGKAEYEVFDLEEESNYYFSVTAVDSFGNESSFSEEVSVYLPVFESGTDVNYDEAALSGELFE